MNEGGRGGSVEVWFELVKCCATAAGMGRGHVGGFWLQFSGVGPGLVGAPGV